MRRPRRPQITHRTRTFVPPTAPELFFRGDHAEPPEVVAFRTALDKDPEAVKEALESHATGPTEIAEADVLDGIVRDILNSRHWSGRPAGLTVDQTTEDMFVATNRSAFEIFGNMGPDHPNFASAQLGLRAGMLVTLATRAADAGIIYRAPDYHL